MKIVFVSSYVPRRCGLATFTLDLSSAVNHQNNGAVTQIITLNEPASQGHSSFPEVCYQIDQNNVKMYKKAADYVNRSDIDVVCLQHEYGLYGGLNGDYILEFISRIKKPIVTTFHTVLETPSCRQYEILCRLVSASKAVIVMASSAADILEKTYRTSSDKIDIIPHGVPDVPTHLAKKIRKELGLEDNLIIATFGLINPGKGIEYAIKSMARIIKECPQACLLILGVTHPSLLKQEGEKYRSYLEDLAVSLKIDKHVHFVNQYFDLPELIRYLTATDIYISPYLNPEQITSGTLAYALGAGKVCISTPYIYAQETLADGRGILVPFRNEKALAGAIIKVANDKLVRKKIEKNAYIYSRPMLWSNVGARYVDLFRQAIG